MTRLRRFPAIQPVRYHVGDEGDEADLLDMFEWRGEASVRGDDEHATTTKVAGGCARGRVKGGRGGGGCGGGGWGEGERGQRLLLSPLGAAGHGAQLKDRGCRLEGVNRRFKIITVEA